MIRLIAAVIICLSATTGRSAWSETDAEVANDLRTVIILAGYRCMEVVEFSQPVPSEYHVSCDADRLYRVRVREDNKVTVESRSHPSPRTSTADRFHEEFVEKQLFAIVNLSGHDCAGVSSYRRGERHENFVTCEDDKTYRIHVTPEGRIAVDKLLIEK